MNAFGQVIRVQFPLRRPQGHEQEGLRPALIVSDPTNQQALESPMLIVAPITSQTKKAGVLRVLLGVGDGGLTEESTILCEQLTSIDVSRIRGYYGRLDGVKLEEARTAIQAALADLLEVDA